jgi:calcineurin-like phosphoesterase family protein
LIGDTHFCHSGVVKFVARPFASTAAMDHHMVACWNSVVGRNDLVFHLGDFAHGGPADRYARIFAQLNGTKRLIMGNHDGPAVLALNWATISSLETITENGMAISLCHYPPYRVASLFQRRFTSVRSLPQSDLSPHKRMIHASVRAFRGRQSDAECQQPRQHPPL